MKTTYDIVGRPVYEDVTTSGTVAQRTSHSYVGRYHTVTPPDTTKTTTTTRTDGFGRVDRVGIPSTPLATIDVAAAVKPDGTRAIFQVLSDGNVYVRESIDGGYTNLGLVGCCGLHKVSATVLPNGAYAVVGLSTNQHIYFTKQTGPGGPWTTWVDVGCCALDVALTTNMDGAVVVPYVGTDKSVYLIGETIAGGSWYAPVSLAGGLVERIAVGRYSDGALHLAVALGNGAVFTKKQNGAGGGFPAAWTQRDCCMIDIGGAVSQTNPGIFVIYGRDASDNSHYRLWETTAGGAWTPRQALGGGPSVNVDANELPNQCSMVVSQRTDGSVEVSEETTCGTWSSWANVNQLSTTTLSTTTYNVRDQIDTSIDAAGYVTDYDYDAMGRLTTVTDPSSGRTTYGYDVNSNLISTIDARSIQTTTTYDALNRPLEHKQGATLLAKTAYDAAGQLGLVDWTSTYTGGAEFKTNYVSYNDLGQPTQTNYVIPATADTTGISGTYAYFAAYRRDGTLLSTTIPGGAVSKERIEYGYTSTGEPATTFGQSLDSNDNVTTTRQYVSATTYDNLGRVDMRKLGDPLVTGKTNVERDYNYDTLGRLSGLIASVKWGSGGATAFQNDTYTYDLHGNVTAIADTLSGQRQCFGYDTRNRLTTTTRVNTTCASFDGAGADPYERTYTYDAITRMTGWTERTTTGATPTSHPYAYTTNSPGGCASGTPAAKPYSPSTMTGVGAYSSYDCAGNVLTRTITAGPAAGTHTLTWDPDGRLATSTKNSVVAKNIYGPGGVRLIRTEGTTRTVYLPHQELTSVNGATATMVRTYPAGPGGPTVAARRTGTDTGVFYLGGDAQGSATWMLKDNTATPTRTKYYPYGAVRGTANQMPIDHGFLGQIEDDQTGLNYLNNRYHDPTTGTFISVDPLVAKTGDPYLYGAANPVTFSDPSGLDVCLTCMVSHDGDTYNAGGRAANSNGLRYVESLNDVATSYGWSGLKAWNDEHAAYEATSTVCTPGKCLAKAGVFVAGTIAVAGCTSVSAGVAAVGCATVAGAATSYANHTLDGDFDVHASDLIAGAITGGTLSAGRYFASRAATSAATNTALQSLTTELEGSARCPPSGVPTDQRGRMPSGTTSSSRRRAT